MLADLMHETGACVRRNAYISTFSTREHDAWLDVWGFGTTDVEDALVDVTIRHPAEGRYQPAASHTSSLGTRHVEAR